ncbi:hypothetical protein Ahy_A03g010252 [Arachis hypogaea]|uniref:MULE transposase domain-containing protein n=1 Tax=Arachis hypogaea TaxID=3818 RepID=A0A445DLQ1_ARAHY|nr:hypothetical protein Ahy_A03g010252 [Arachis hypogaea]
MFVCRTIENDDEVGIRPSKRYQSFIVTIGGHDDAKVFRKYLLRLKENNHNFFYEIEPEVNHSIKNTFWADAKSQSAFEYFGKISFDTTYNTNRYLLYNLIFGSFVDVNHHEIQSFKWLFECWLGYMGGKVPKGILTECALMQRDIELCMPTIVHMWCIWHIMKKIPHKLNGYKRHEEIEQEMSHAI